MALVATNISFVVKFTFAINLTIIIMVVVVVCSQMKERIEEKIHILKNKQQVEYDQMIIFRMGELLVFSAGKILVFLPFIKFTLPPATI